MKKLLLLALIVGGIVAYIATLDEDVRTKYKDTAKDLVSGWFDFGADERPNIKEETVCGPILGTRIVSADIEGTFSARSLDNDIVGTRMIIGSGGWIQYSWDEGGRYMTDYFSVYAEGVDYTPRFKVRVIDVQGDVELCDVLEFKVAQFSGGEYPIDTFIGGVAESGSQNLRSYAVVAYMPEDVADEYKFLHLTDISLEIEIIGEN